MNLNRLKEIEAYFFETYPEGFDDIALLPIVKRHNTAKITAQTKDSFKADNFAQPQKIIENMATIIAKSSLISLFEKPLFKNETQAMNMAQKDTLSIGLYEFLYGRKAEGFELMVDVLAEKKLAKWTYVTAIGYYFYPDREYFVKPTTTKDIIRYLKLENLYYKPRPSYAFYANYQKALDECKTYVSPTLGSDNAKFTGFLRMGIQALDIK